MVYIAFVCLGVSTLVACGNIAGSIGAVIRKRRGIDQGYTCIPLVSILFSSLAWVLGGTTIGALAFIPAALDPGTWMLVALPFALIDFPQRQRKGAAGQPEGNAMPRSSGSAMNTTTALRLLGPLASLVYQRRYIVEGTVDGYIGPDDLINNGDNFINYPGIGETAKLPSVQEFSRILTEAAQTIPFDDPMFTNWMLVEHNPEWDKLRSAARNVLLELGGDIGEWERKELEHTDA